MRTFCSRPGCPKIVDTVGRCTSCSNDGACIRRQSVRHKQDCRFYDSKAWKRLRREQLNAEPLCVACLADGKTTEARHIDHIIPRSHDPSLELCFDNLQSLCVACHGRKTHTEQAKGL